MEVCVARHNGDADGYDQAYAMALDDQGNVYVTGRSSYTGESYDAVTIKYDPNCNEVWAAPARYTGSTHEYDGPVDIHVDADSYVYVTGYCNAGMFGGSWLTIKYNPDGTEMWSQCDPSGSGSAITVDSQGNVIVTGSSAGTYGQDLTTIKYGPDGTQLWVRQYNGPVNVDDYAEDVTVDETDSIYVTGSGNCAGIGT